MEMDEIKPGPTVIELDCLTKGRTDKILLPQPPEPLELQFVIGMSDFSEELTKTISEDDQVETSVLTGTGMYFPWLQKHLETVVTGGKKKKDFAQTTSACLNFIQEALLKHEWQQAAEYMYSCLQILKDSDTYKKHAAPEVNKV
ncbi:TATA box-binding protein-associated factor RNA polymerase I subunit A-like [Ictidomys tridecemlineatus]